MTSINTQDITQFLGWQSTYNHITAQRLLAIYKISLSDADLVYALRCSTNYYTRLLKLPYKTVLINIIIQQTHDYQVYLQKLFVDYLLSGVNDKNDTAPGAQLRDDLEDLRQGLINVNEDFHQLELLHEQLINDIQKNLIEKTKIWCMNVDRTINQVYTIVKLKHSYLTVDLITECVNSFLAYHSFQTLKLTSSDFEKKMKARLKLDDFLPIQKILEEIFPIFAKQNEELTQVLELYSDKIIQVHRKSLDFRSIFWQKIIKVSELLRALPDYRFDEIQLSMNQENLQFDRNVGESID